MAACILYLVILFSNILEQVIPQGSYIDELLFFVFLLGTAMKISVVRAGLDGWNRYDFAIAILLLFFLMTGTVSTLLYGKDSPGVAVAKDIILCGKFFAVFLCGKLLFLTADRDKILGRIRKVTRLLVLVIFLCGILSLFVNIGMGDQIRYGLRSYQFLFTHYMFLVYAEAVMTAVLCTGKDEDNRIYIAMALGSMLLTLRTKAVVFCVIFLMFFLLEKIGKDIRFRYYVIAGAAGAVAAWGKISEYLSWGFTYNMRNGLYMKGISLAMAHFPLGTGFASFGSNLSYEYNPQIYYDLGLDSFQGFEHGTPVLSDVFWPYIFGEFGVIGFVLYTGMLILLFFSLKEELRGYSEMMRGANCLFAYLLVASAAEAVFTNSTGVCCALFLSIYFRRTCRNTDELSENRSPFLIRF